MPLWCWSCLEFKERPTCFRVDFDCRRTMEDSTRRLQTKENMKKEGASTKKKNLTDWIG